MTFETLNLHQHLNKAIREQGYMVPTPIQEKAIPTVLEGRDVLGLAQTGTGKTAAFVLPLLHRLMGGPRRRLRVLILAPTRELADQTHDAIRSLGRYTGFRSTVIYGGVNMNPQIAAIKRGTEIIVACPGRLLDHAAQKNIDLSTVETFVIDEADRMFDMGFLPDVRRIVRLLPQKRQNLLFSATMPDDIRCLSDEVLHKAATIQVGFEKPLETISHALYPVEQHLKTPLLRELLKRTETDSVLIFTRTKHRAKRLAEQLEHSGFRTTCLQGNLSQSQRQKAIEGFRKGSYQILVATDIAARGIDVSAISHVINYDMPDTADAYTHRIGRTGRAAKSGEAYTFVTSEDTAMAYTIECMFGASLEQKILPGFDYRRPAPAGTGKPSMHAKKGGYRSVRQPAKGRLSGPADRYRIQISAR